MAQDKQPVLLQDATTDQLAEAVAAGVHVGLRRLFADLEAFTALRRVVDQVDVHAD
ncbi:MAG: hypothetical protein U1C74_21585 [Phenylobacterium sp.]|nr:hypothetical protein [Phenylobacterium sp.]